MNKLENYKINDQPFYEMPCGSIFAGLRKEDNMSVLIKIIPRSTYIQSKYSLDILLKNIKFFSSLNKTTLLRFIEIFKNEENFYLVCEGAAEKSLPNYLKTKSLEDYEIFKLLLVIMKTYIPYAQNKQMHLSISKSGIFKIGSFFKIMPFFLFNHLEVIKNANFIDIYNIAPEILLQKCISVKSDIWMIGVLLFEIILGYKPFKENEDHAKLLDEIKNFKKSFKPKDNKEILIAELLNEDPIERMEFREILFSKFFIENLKTLDQNFKDSIANLNYLVTQNSKANKISDNVKKIFEENKGNSKWIHNHSIVQKLETENGPIAELAYLTRCYRECLEFFKDFSCDFVSFESIEDILKNSASANIPAEKIESVIPNPEEKMSKAKTLRHKIQRKKELALPELKDLMAATYLYQYDFKKQLEKLIESIKKFSKELESILPVFIISKYGYFRYKNYLIQLTKDVNIFEFPQWEILKKDALFDNLKTEDSEYFLKESSDSYFNLQLFRENSKKYYDLNEAEALFIQGSDLNKILFGHTHFQLGFQSLMIRYLKDLIGRGNTEFYKVQDKSRPYYVVAYQLIELALFVRNYGVARMGELDLDLTELRSEAEKMDIIKLSEKIKTMNELLK